ncbi:Bug family tripartite tricarboxylate transporter substrate binding protein [Variovorax paradoxus]|uniref:Tripartite tricarboxylate transporter family receptor n=1 Tax=Variovorax paradoxus TaxID=34073 RepID=A0A0H2M6F5_VARPD|nr:tripartite tricarboxylate transporter substrate binding protein [Variovorax paradoxus]KLN56367.1 tripartite tricarboxylate transporter family receptor [Variovorax paradoxus]
MQRARAFNSKEIMQITRRHFTIGTAVSVIAPAWAQTYPSKPINIVVGFAAGGGIDVVMRNLAPGLSQRLGQPVVIENRPGAGGMIAASQVAKAPPDGHTLFPGDAATLALNGALFSKLPYDPAADFAPISMVIRAPILIVAHSQAPFSDLRGLVEYAKRQPGGVSYASPGNGTMHQLAMELFRRRAGFSATPIQYKGAGAAIQDILSGQVPIGPIDTIVALSHVHAGKLKALAVLAPNRIAQLPGVPSAQELGVEGAVAYPWIGLSAPRGTPANVIARLNADVRAVLTSPEISKKFTDLGMEPMPTTPEEFGTFMKQEIARWHPLIKELNIRLD